jgi:hypothetical protein
MLELSIVFVNIAAVANKRRMGSGARMPAIWTDCHQPMQNWSRSAANVGETTRYAIA